MSRGEPVAMVIPTSSTENLVADVVEAEWELELFGEHARLRVDGRSLAGRNVALHWPEPQGLPTPDSHGLHEILSRLRYAQVLQENPGIAYCFE
jgi:hypothetical protein